MSFLQAGPFLAALPLAAGLLPAVHLPAQAQDFTVTSGSTVGGQTMANAGDTGTIEAGGAILTGTTSGVSMGNAGQIVLNGGSVSTTGDFNNGIHSFAADATITSTGTIATTGNGARGIYATGSGASIIHSGTITTAGAQGIEATGDGSSITNSGSIAATADSTFGLRSTGDNATINQSGDITTSGFASYALSSEGDDASITHSGTIRTTGTISHGIASTGRNAMITSSGSITTTDGSSDGILASRDNAVINNSGSITTTGFSSDGIDAWGDGVSITNSGTIVTADRFAQGINASGDNVSITHSGTIVTDRPDSPGIEAGGANARVTVAGRIQSPNSDAIRFGAGAQDNALTLLPGTVIEGGIRLGGGTDTVTIGRGLSIAATFDKTPEIFNAGWAPSAISGTQIAVADPTTLSTSDEHLADLTGGIFSTVQGRLDGLRARTGGAVATHGPPGADPAATGSEFWMQGFGSYRNQRGAGAALDSNLRVAGFVLGLDGEAFGDMRAGVFLGGSVGDVKGSSGTQKTGSTGIFGGLYGSRIWAGTAIDVALAAGWSAYDRERQIANNLLPGGVETATADYGGWFVSPELTLTRPIPGTVMPGGLPLETHVTLRYAGLFLDGYTEAATAGGLTMNAQSVHLGTARAGLTLPVEQELEDGGLARLKLTGGVEGRTQFGGQTLSGALLGQSIVFDPGGDSSALAGFAGLTGEYAAANGLTLFATVEGQLETTGSRQASAWLGLRKRF